VKQLGSAGPIPPSSRDFEPLLSGSRHLNCVTLLRLAEAVWHESRVATQWKSTGPGSLRARVAKWCHGHLAQSARHLTRNSRSPVLIPSPRPWRWRVATDDGLRRSIARQIPAAPVTAHDHALFHLPNLSTNARPPRSHRRPYGTQSHSGQPRSDLHGRPRPEHGGKSGERRCPIMFWFMSFDTSRRPTSATSLNEAHSGRSPPPTPLQTRPRELACSRRPPRGDAAASRFAKHGRA
jgi:hypothetical protein